MLSQREVGESFVKLGVNPGDTVLIRAGLKAIGRIHRTTFLRGLLDAVGHDGTVVSLAFTRSWIWKADSAAAFQSDTATTSGALPQAMIESPDAVRSRHPTCSYVAIGARAREIVGNHDHDSPAYEPVRRMMNLGGKGVLVGCVNDSPGFTTAHLAEYDLGFHKRVIMPSLTCAYFYGDDGTLKLFRRRDLGLCSQSYWKFYSHYVCAGLLRTGQIGNAYAVLAPLNDTYRIEREVLSRDPQFNICAKPLCVTCNARRWDRLHCLPLFMVRWISRRLARSRSAER